MKKALPDLKIVLSDPEGSGLFNKVRFNVMFDPKESEGKKRRHQVDTVVEGIGKCEILSMILKAYSNSGINRVRVETAKLMVSNPLNRSPIISLWDYR